LANKSLKGLKKSPRQRFSPTRHSHHWGDGNGWTL